MLSIYSINSIQRKRKGAEKNQQREKHFGQIPNFQAYTDVCTRVQHTQSEAKRKTITHNWKKIRHDLKSHSTHSESGQ